MHRFFTSPENIVDKKAILYGVDVSHIRTVLRLKKGDRIQILDGCGNCYTVTLTCLGRDNIESRIDLKEDANSCESPLMISLGQVMVKGTGFDGIVRRAVELGVGEVIPVSSYRCIPKISDNDIKKKMDRWSRIAREASKQCGRSRIPTVGPNTTSVKEFCSAYQDAGLKLIFWEEEQSIKIKDLPHESQFDSAAVLIGPEGGFSSGEVEISREYAFQSVSLGPRLLRTETAPLAAISIIQHHWGDL
jgi:16S rRNA (uracil1498-N3)-methyltransferase